VDTKGETIPNQWQYLKTIQKNHLLQIQGFLTAKNHFTNAVLAKQIKQPENGNQDLQRQVDETEPSVPTTQGQQAELILGAGIFIPN